ncbi:MAG: hypothetical protein WB998_04950 [Solirubrobacteraceae bacterium]
MNSVAGLDRDLVIVLDDLHRADGGCLASIDYGLEGLPSNDGPGFEALKSALEEACERPMTTEGQGGSIPLCNVFADTYPEAEIFLIGVEEPTYLIHALNESVDPSEIENLALAEALFLEKYATAGR